VLSPEAHYLRIAGRAPPASWSRSIARNPYLQTVLSKGSATPGFPAAFNSTLGQHNNAAQEQQPQQHQGAQVLQIEHRAQTPAYGYSSGSQSARGPVPPSFPSPRGIHSSAGARPMTGAAQHQQQQQQRGLHSSAGFGASSNALNPFNGGASFIPEANFNQHHGVGVGGGVRSIPPTPLSMSGGVGSLSARVVPSSSSRPPFQPPQPPSSLSSPYGQGAEAFANILAAPAPERRPQTGVSVYKRGGQSNRPLPPVRQRL
jgi:hypothetical protein